MSINTRILRRGAQQHSRRLLRVVLGLASACACVAVGGCESLAGEQAGGIVQAPARKGAYIDRKVGSTYEGIALKPDGTYSRTVVDSWGRSYQQQGTWRGYGGTMQSGRSYVNRRIELDGYSDARDVINGGGAQTAPKATKSLSPGDFYTR